MNWYPISDFSVAADKRVETAAAWPDLEVLRLLRADTDFLGASHSEKQLILGLFAQNSIPNSGK